MLEREGIDIGAHIVDVGGIADAMFDPVNVDAEALEAVRQAGFPVISEESGGLMREAIEAARRDGDSLGGIIECAAIGVRAGLGDPIFDGVENRIAGIVFGIPAVRGIEFGNGFASTFLRGSANNDAFYMDGSEVRTRTNNHGGILGGITSGLPVIFRVAIKPTPSIIRQQDSVRLSREPASQYDGTDAKIEIHGRHDPCIVPRAVPCIESAAAIAILDFISGRPAPL
jgi:chorismate synthase